MTLLKKSIIALFVSILMLGSMQSVMAMEASAPAQTLADVIDLNKQTIAAMKAGDTAEKVGALLKATKQASKSVVISGPADLNKQKGSMKLKRSRKAYRAGDTVEAIRLAEEALDKYKKAKSVHFN
ncbi:MAG: hypothetical protein HFP81_08580 [Methylococcales symbiont of Hymedesmia sp. n. MRB-2018]|nr:MAG: hypothetical protein HFP78_08810 [Methylococcales symbiont of Hymedesmia sp. n. MRB-2018]KAF3983227.1 MAG: hypothetical protein HFP81_08580 [Methylococcales symbiont of Hymedesmia sp. n. MRB-2018]